MATQLASFAAERGVKYFLVSYTDLFGAQRAKLVPTAAIEAAEAAGAGFAGFSTWLDMSPADPDMQAMPDPASVTQLPWKPEVAWVATDLMMGGEPVAQAPRVTLKRVLANAAEEGLIIRTGIEAEYFLVTPEGDAISDSQDIAEKPCYDQQALMRRYDVITEICDYMAELGWGPYQNDHEDGNGQFEMNFDFADALTTADRHSFFKFMVKSVAEKHGLRATFMPKPFPGKTGNGCHCHISAWDKKGANLFLDDEDELGLSRLAMHFLGGVMNNAKALTAIANPVVNSYKRVNAPVTASGATWAPNTATWSGNNRTHMVRVPGPGRFELRLADGAANPYLFQAATIAAGLLGVQGEMDPGPRSDLDMYAEARKARASSRLPLSLVDALREFNRNAALKAALGDEASAAFMKLKTDEWLSFTSHFTEWERVNALDI